MQYENDEGIKIDAGKTSGPRPDYSKASDAQLLDVDPNAPDLGDLGRTPVATPASAKTEAPEWVTLDENNEPIEPGQKAKPAEDDKGKEAESKPDDEPEVTEPVAKDKGKTEEVAEPLTPLKVTEEIKAHFQDPKVGRELKNAFYGYAAYKEVIPKIEDARELVELFPTIDDARQVAEAHQAFSEFQESFEKDPDGFIDSLHEEGKEEGEFAAIAVAMMNRLPELDPHTYARVGREVLLDYLATALDLSNRGESRGDPENLRNAVDVVCMNLFNGKKYDQVDRAPDEKDSKIQELEGRLHDEKRSKVAETRRAFGQKVDGFVNERVSDRIDKMLNTLLDSEGVAVDPVRKQTIGEEIFASVRDAILSNPRLEKQVKDLAGMRGGDYGSRHLRVVADPILRQAELEVKKFAAKIVKKHTESILSKNKGSLEKQRQAATRRDFGSGSSGDLGRVGGGISPERIDYHRTSDADILDDRVALKR